PLTETLTLAGGVLHEPFFLDDVEGGQGGPGGHRVTAVGAALGTGPGLLHDRGGRGDRRQRETAGPPLGGDAAVGTAPGGFVAPEGPGASEPGLDLVGD